MLDVIQLQSNQQAAGAIKGMFYYMHHNAAALLALGTQK